MIATRSGPHKYYKGKYFIVFYDLDDKALMYMFDNVREILKFQGREQTRQNVNLVNVELYRAFKSERHITRFLTGEPLCVYIIDVEGD